MKKTYFISGIIALLLMTSLNAYGQKCEKFINYQTRSVDVKGLNIKIPGIAPANLLPVNVSTLQRTTSERLEMLDMLQYNLCQKMAKIKVPVLKETMEVEYSNFLMEMMSLLVAEGGSGSNAQTQQQVEKQQKQDGQRQDKIEPEPAPTPAPTPLPQPVVPPVAGKIKINFPCKIEETDGFLRGGGMEESSDVQIARQMATTIAISDLASRVEISVKSAIDYQVKRVENNQSEDLEKRYEMKTEQTVEQTLKGWRLVCEECEFDPNKNKYSCYVVVEISETNVLKPIYNELIKDNELKKALPPIEDFQKVFKSMNNIKKGNSFYEGF